MDHLPLPNNPLKVDYHVPLLCESGFVECGLDGFAEYPSQNVGLVTHCHSCRLIIDGFKPS